MDDMLARIREEGGVVRSARLIEWGFPEQHLRAALARGVLRRIRRFWVAVPDADRLLLAAARAGVVLSCVTEAKRLGLWVVDDGRFHLGAHAHSGRVAIESDVRIHRARPLIPRHPDALTDPIENVLALIAACQPHEHALATWESALRHEHVDRLALARLPLGAKARRVLDEATPFSDSGLETFVPTRLRWTRQRIVAQVFIAGHHVDFLIGDRLVLQIDGAHHVGPQRTSDIAHDAELTLLGYHVIRVGYQQVMHDWPEVQRQIARAIAQRLHLAD